jgi:hypothetical protein
MKSRRDFLWDSGHGFGALALGSLLASQRTAAAELRSHHPAKAKSVIFLFMEGGPSHLDLFDPKPLLNELAGKPLPASFGDVITAMGESKSPLLASARTFPRSPPVWTTSRSSVPAGPTASTTPQASAR